MNTNAKKNRKMINNEKGFGFMESLIAILIGGIACTALLTVAVGVMREAKNNEIRDALSYYGVQGLEQVRYLASLDYNNNIRIHTGVGTSYSRIDGEELKKITVSNDRCSYMGEYQGECETLAMPDGTAGGDEILYREVWLKCVDTTCDQVRVTVKVGMRANPEEDIAKNRDVGDFPRNFISEVSMIGFVAE